MKLVIDIGNSSTKIAIFSNDDIVDFKIAAKITQKGISTTLAEYPEIQSSIISSVSKFDRKIIDLLHSVGQVIELSYETPLPIIVKYGTPTTLGKDRLAIASAASTIYPGENVLAIDAGTCVTFDMINKNGEFLGGAISPGLNMRLKALNTFTDGLPLVELPSATNELELIGNTTETSILSGVIIGLTSEMENVINQYESRFSPLKVLISGGDYKYFVKLAKSNIFASPNIVIRGLKKILDFNEEN